MRPLKGLHISKYRTTLRRDFSRGWQNRSYPTVYWEWSSFIGILHSDFLHQTALHSLSWKPLRSLMVPGVAASDCLQTECLNCKFFALNWVNHHSFPSEFALNLKMDINGTEVNLYLHKTHLYWTVVSLKIMPSVAPRNFNSNSL